MEVVTVQLVFSDGGLPRFEENLWQLYTIALTPFVFDIPAAQVAMVVAKGFQAASDEQIRRVHNDLVVERNVPILPDEYCSYFQSIYANARSTEAFPLPPCTLRLITGHGFGNFGGGNISVGGKVVRYPDLGSNATALTILDISNSVYAVAHFEENIPPKNKWHLFTKEFRTMVFQQNKTVPVACDQNEATWAFRIGFQGQHETTASWENETDNLRMSRPVGDSVACSFLVAAKKFAAQDASHLQRLDMDTLFRQEYLLLHTSLLQGNHSLLPHSSLTKIEDLINSGVLVPNERVFDVPFFTNRREWFLTMERVVCLTSEDGENADEIIRFVVDSIVGWYEDNSDRIGSDDVDCSSQWRILLSVMGPFRQDLKKIQLISEDDEHLSESTQGLELEVWASACGILPTVLAKVQSKIRTGYFDELPPA
jgi:hypothetical protein